MSTEILTQMVGKTTAVEVWTTVTEMFPSQSKARIVQLRSTLNKARKGDKSASVYFNHIKNLADEMASAGKPLDEDDVISYILAGLHDEAYNGFVAAITALIKADKKVSLSDLFSQLTSYEARLGEQNSVGESSINHYRKILLFRVRTVCRGSTHGIDNYTVSHTLQPTAKYRLTANKTEAHGESRTHGILQQKLTAKHSTRRNMIKAHGRVRAHGKLVIGPTLEAGLTARCDGGHLPCA
jgi:hypothetical protein